MTAEKTHAQTNGTHWCYTLFFYFGRLMTSFVRLCFNHKLRSGPIKTRPLHRPLYEKLLPGEGVHDIDMTFTGTFNLVLVMPLRVPPVAVIEGDFHFGSKTRISNMMNDDSFFRSDCACMMVQDCDILVMNTLESIGKNCPNM